MPIDLTKTPEYRAWMDDMFIKYHDLIAEEYQDFPQSIIEWIIWNAEND
jgi:hypothetical protein